MDARIEKLADLLVSYSMKIKPGENCLIDYTGEAPTGLVKALVNRVYKAGGRPYVTSDDSSVRRALLMQADETQLQIMADNQLDFMKKMHAYVAVRAGNNNSELSDVPPEKLSLYSRIMSPVLDYRVNSTKWVVLRYPNDSMAQLASMSTEAFEDFYYDVCTMDYAKMDRAMDALTARLDAASEVHITGPGTDLYLDISGMTSVKCAGDKNIPDGEVFTAPRRNGVNGVISYNTPSLQQGFTFENIRFEIKDGKIVNASANDTARINSILDTDEGARYFGEFAIGVNPYVLKPMKDTLFDEKICGSFHFTPGRCYEECDNGNHSAIHWDLVMIQRADCGGGEMYFDGQLVRKDGIFVTEDLKCLNPENLK